MPWDRRRGPEPGPEGAGAASQAPAFLGTKGDTLDQIWRDEPLEGLGRAALLHRQRPGARNSADSQRKE